ncbi:MAG: hypothetical protein NWE89_09135 [Candidatus Bathyarchaeota archaeon]|nr:hypothetical protein [Candidatus Bathyarchaeota archaeon]
MSNREITSRHIYGTDIQEMVERMKEITAEIENRAKEIGTKKGRFLRADPQINRLWRKLCVLHMRGLVICEEIGYNTKACMFIREPQACQKVLEIPREETCCGRFFGIEDGD